ncbi:MAG: hypothetical protein AAF560_06005 [Acidobacteriota bacterium]
MTINVDFRVVGMYFGSSASVTNKVTVEVEDTPTVAKIMTAVAQKVAGGGVDGVSQFTFSPLQPATGEELFSITINYTDPPKNNLPTGNYFLASDLAGNPEEVWQYYIFDTNFEQVNRNNDFIPFSEQPAEPIEDGYTVIWRRVSILVGATASRFVASRANKAAAHFGG